MALVNGVVGRKRQVGGWLGGEGVVVGEEVRRMLEVYGVKEEGGERLNKLEMKIKQALRK